VDSKKPKKSNQSFCSVLTCPGNEADCARLYPLEMLNLANYLLALPEPFETERDTTPLRGFDFD
jgi:hypothetical protein